MTRPDTATNTTNPDTEFPEAAVLSAAAAPVPAAWAAAVASERYGLTGTLSPLTGERDANFLLRVDDPAGERRFMLKISHPVETPLVADFQTQALLHLAQTDPDLPVQRLVPTLYGAPSFTDRAPDGSIRVVRLFTYLAGMPMPQAPRSEAQSKAVARALARLDIALSGMQHPAGSLELPWDIQRADRARGLLVHVADPAQRAVAERAFDDFTKRVKPALAELRRQPIHNDFNIYNLLVDPNAPDQVSGILDFGDMVEAPLINDVAVAASYQLDEKGDVLASLSSFVSAYDRLNRLNTDELNVLFDLIRARLAMVVAISGWRAARHPENADYLMRNNAVSWARLKACDAIPLPVAQLALYRACNFSYELNGPR
ncbi:phosphotransferase [Pigmentiphaga aceris]|uniref:Hydroxylysine kinase n=1 Tax=Pigmentiphaga aceris TaxID=1940612 RepID=A0A5C0B4X5_9BURK|nr:phosphotransferase [Pigmentiphaga aceris]QEI09114.1 phosphotransferase [Pigmentiphaga aceris]